MSIWGRRKGEHSSNADWIEILKDERYWTQNWPPRRRGENKWHHSKACTRAYEPVLVSRSFEVMILSRTNQHKHGLSRRDAKWRAFVIRQGQLLTMFTNTTLNRLVLRDVKHENSSMVVFGLHLLINSSVTTNGSVYTRSILFGTGGKVQSLKLRSLRVSVKQWMER